MTTRPVHKTRVKRGGGGMWYADCLTCPKPLQHPVSHWFGHHTWDAAFDTAWRHNHPNRWLRT